MPPGHLDGHLPMGWLKNDNRDIKWEKVSQKRRSAYCKTHCVRSKSPRELFMCEELLAEDPNNMFDCGMGRWTGEDVLSRVGMAYTNILSCLWDFSMQHQLVRE